MKKNVKGEKVLNFIYGHGALLGSSSGFSLIEVITVAAIMAVLLLGMLTLQNNQMKSNNYLSFQLKRTQLQGTILGQFLNDPNNCACLFAGAAAFSANPAAPGATLTGVNPTQIGKYNFINPGNCLTATMPAPFVSASGIDGIRSTSIQLADIRNIGGSYTGNLVVNLRSLKEVLGPADLSLSVPVNVVTTPAGSNVLFVNCSVRGSTTAFAVKEKSCTDNFHETNTSQFTNHECNPPACAAGETGEFQGCQPAQDRNYWRPITCYRICFAGQMAPGFSFRHYCSFGQVDGTPLTDNACHPAPCPASSSDYGINCIGTNLGNNWIGGYCQRTCVAN